ncbi:hypothetical protein PGQ11_001783 [Apiospora arundinis]|uniref:HTH araC/xylS-type domain-containing protein n=1 Tax=Apiospora arundinis TaxID=335852 RepID=A0ABR2JG41_9PEZI
MHEKGRPIRREYVLAVMRFRDAVYAAADQQAGPVSALDIALLTGPRFDRQTFERFWGEFYGASGTQHLTHSRTDLPPSHHIKKGGRVKEQSESVVIAKRHKYNTETAS